eukprot:10177968-Heterocapsa_arctica.AAC.1
MLCSRITSTLSGATDYDVDLAISQTLISNITLRMFQYKCSYHETDHCVAVCPQRHGDTKHGGRCQ